MNIPLVNGKTYYAAKVAGTCESATRAEVQVTIGDERPARPSMITPQSFCDGAVIANLAVPNNQILWYTSETGGIALASDQVLADGTYYAAQRAGNCASSTRAAVVVTLGNPSKPEAQPTQTLCGSVTGTLASLQVTGSGIVWYTALTGGERLSLDEPLVPTATYYAAQVSGDCESPRTAVYVTNDCFTLRGTVFPFVQVGFEEFDNLFPVYAKLTQYIDPQSTMDPVGAARRATIYHTVTAKLYDGSTYVSTTPKNPGRMGALNNPPANNPILWANIGRNVPGNLVVDNTLVSGPGDVPISPVGLFTFENVAPGDYLLQISRIGYMTRIAKVTVNKDGSLGHRELLPGAAGNDMRITVSDVSMTKDRSGAIYDLDPQLRSADYNPKYDFNADGIIDSKDMTIVLENLAAPSVDEVYNDTYEWVWSY